jgi:hypothetical protein
MGKGGEVRRDKGGIDVSQHMLRLLPPFDSSATLLLIVRLELPGQEDFDDKARCRGLDLDRQRG